MATEMNALVQMPTTDATALIAVTQLPIITERLRDVKTAVEATVEEAKSMVATADTIQAVKTRRAELNKQFAELEAQRKAVKAQIMAPYEKFEVVYKECIAGPFRDADISLKATVDEYTGTIKKRALSRLEEYYYELCCADGIDWLPFAKAMMASDTKISMEDCKTKEPRKAMDKLGLFLSKVGIGLDQIRQMDDSAEIMAEFQKTLDVGEAIATVQDRKRRIREAEEAETRRREEDARRQEMLEKVKAAAPAQVETPAPVANPEKYPPSIGFKIYFRNAEEYQAVKPLLVQLRDTLIREGIQYGK